MFKKRENYILIGFEKWTTLNWNGILVPRYTISDYGRIYDNRDNRLLTYSLDKDGYFMASLYIDQIEDGCKYKKIRVHRFELLSFDFRPDFKDLVVNHRDGNKLNLLLSNLEWSTSIENTRHGWNNSLNKNIGINNGKGKYDDKTLHMLCQYIDDGLTNSEICDILGLLGDDRTRLNSNLSSIRMMKTHRNISSQYNFGKGIKVHNQYSKEIAINVCKLLSDNNDYTYNEIADLLNIPDNERLNFRVFINDLVHGRTFKSIGSQYNLKKPI